MCLAGASLIVASGCGRKEKPKVVEVKTVEPEAEEAPEEPEESPEEGNPFLDSATRAIKLSDLKFGRNYHGEE